MLVCDNESGWGNKCGSDSPQSMIAWTISGWERLWEQLRMQCHKWTTSGSMGGQLKLNICPDLKWLTIKWPSGVTVVKNGWLQCELIDMAVISIIDITVIMGESGSWVLLGCEGIVSQPIRSSSSPTHFLSAGEEWSWGGCEGKCGSATGCHLQPTSLHTIPPFS